MTSDTSTRTQIAIRVLRDKHARFGNSADTAYWTVRDSIRNGLIEPGERLIELDLAATLEMSRTPVREALRRLATERMIESSNGRGYVVPTASIDELVDLFEIRGVLEGLAARRAATRMNPAQIQAMGDTITRMERALENDDYTTLSQASLKFHQLLRPGPRESRIADLISLTADAVPGLAAHEMTPDRVDDAIREHRLIYEAIRDRNPDEAERLARVHAEHALAATIRAFQLAT